MKTHLLILSAITLNALAFGQGSLTPPGAPGPTMRTLDDIEPRIPLNQVTTPGDSTAVFKITQPGSYVLTRNLEPPTGKNGILIALLVPGVVAIDLKGFAVDGKNADATRIGIANVNSLADDSNTVSISNGTIRGFGGGACVAPSASGTTELRCIRIQGGGAGVNAAGRLVMDDVIISSVTGLPIQMGSDSMISHLQIKAGIPKVIDTTGGNHVLVDVTAESYSFGASNPGSWVRLGPGSRIHGMRAVISDATFGGTIFSNSSGFSEVSGLSIEATNVTAPSACDSLLFTSSQGPYQILTSSQGPYQLYTSSQGPYQINVKNCTFGNSIVVLNEAANSADCCTPACIVASGTTTAPSALRVMGDNVALTASVIINNGATITGSAIDVQGSGTTIHASVRGTSVDASLRLSSGSGHLVEDCHFFGNGSAATTAIRIASGVTNALVRNNHATRLGAGGTFVDNLGGASNGIAPVVTPGNINATTNAMANIVQ